MVTGVVKNLTEYGAFVDLGGIDGLLHVSDMSHGRVDHPSEVLQRRRRDHGQGPQVRPRKGTHLAGAQTGRCRTRGSMSRSAIPTNARVIGRVVSVTDYGAFVELEPGVEGLIHISEMTWSRRMKHPSKVVKVGDEVEAVVLGVKPRDRRISLGIKQLEADPWTTVEPLQRRLGGRGPRAQSSPISARSSKSRRASTDWCTSPTSPGPNASSIPPRC